MIESRHPGMSGSRGNPPIAPEVDLEGPQKGRSDRMPRFIGQILRPSSGYYVDSETSPSPNFEPAPLPKDSSMSTPGDCRYSESHEWFRLEGDMVTIGITQHAADELTDITYVEMAPAGSAIDAGGSLGEVESVKTTAEVISAVGGEVKEVNEALAADPSILNNAPYQAGWLVKIAVTDSSPLDGLMDSATYDERNG